MAVIYKAVKKCIYSKRNETRQPRLAGLGEALQLKRYDLFEASETTCTESMEKRDFRLPRID